MTLFGFRRFITESYIPMYRLVSRRLSSFNPEEARSSITFRISPVDHAGILIQLDSIAEENGFKKIRPEIGILASYSNGDEMFDVVSSSKRIITVKFNVGK